MNPLPHDGQAPLRPAQLCRELLDALAASEGRRRRKRDTTPDAIRLGIKRELLEAPVSEDPAGHAFEEWLLERCRRARDASPGAVRMMALEILTEWRLAEASRDFRAWLHRGAPSDDAGGD